MPSRHRVPVWMMGLTNLTYGLYGGAVAFAVPQLLGDRHVPEAAIAGLTAIAFSPGFWAFAFSPTLDVRFSRRWYATALAIVAAVTLVIAFLNLDHLRLLTAVLTVGFSRRICIRARWVDGCRRLRMKRKRRRSASGLRWGMWADSARWRWVVTRS